MTLAGTDLWTLGFGGFTNLPDLGFYTPNLLGTNNLITSVWDGFYRGINQCNAVVSRSKDLIGQSDSNDQNRLTAIIGEARFLRALYYFHLVQQFGDVHFSLEETIGVETEAFRTPVATIYEEGIVPDLQFSIDNLPETTDDYGRVTKPAAQALMARVQLTVGNWAEALENAENVIGNNNYSLVKPYGELWNINNQINSEVILAAQYSTDVRISSRQNISHVLFIAHYFYNPALEYSLEYGRGHNRFMPTNKLLKLFDSSIDGRWDGSFKTVWLANTTGVINGHTVNPGDTAMKIVTYPIPDPIQETAPYWYIDFNDNWVGGMTYESLEIGGGLRRWWPSLVKYYDPWRTDPLATHGTRDAPIIRLGE
ncbi:MAG: RagB/SusD family nutrient uptake outer membrane protein, partial [Cyclobacteriaceae bacterium]